MASPLPKPGEAGSVQSVGDGLDGGAHTAADLRCRGRDADQDIGHAGAGDLRASRGEVSNVMTRTRQRQWLGHQADFASTKPLHRHGAGAAPAGRSWMICALVIAV